MSDICEVCNQPVVAGQAHNAATGNHWDCDYPEGYKSSEELLDEMLDITKKMQVELDSLRRKCNGS